MIVTWKNETGMLGPVHIWKSNKERKQLHPYDPNRAPAPWVTRAKAKALARKLKASFEEV